MTEIADRHYPTSGEAKSFARDKSGAAAIEFGILALPFFLIVFAIIETSLVFMAETSMDNAVRRVGRSVRVGDFAPSSEGELRQHICSETVGLFVCEKFKVSGANDAVNLALAKDECYTKGDAKGVMIVGSFSGQ